MNKADILIVGAGAAGLMAACDLVSFGKNVTLLEARGRCGGRIHTLNNELFFKATELGAEFIHGDLPVTLNLLNEAKILYHTAGGEMWHYHNGKFDDEGGEMEGWDLLMNKLKELKQDISINEFLENEFPGDKFVQLKNSVRKFVCGYDTADPDQASSFALRREWQSEDEAAQYRIQGGYGAIIKYLEYVFKSAGGNIYVHSVAKNIFWEPGKVRVVIDSGEIYEARQLLIALPLGVLQAEENEKGAITFHPQIPFQKAAIQKMGFGAIIKILLEFDVPFWEDKITGTMAGKGLKNMSFLLSEETIPTWWTQVPDRSPVLTGWLGGPAAAKHKDARNDEILRLSLQSLSNIFKRSPKELKDKLVAFNIMNWTNEPFTRGSYAYDTIETPAARKLLKTQVSDTIFFAGEYLYDGPAMGTVEAALTSGKEAAKRMVT